MAKAWQVKTYIDITDIGLPGILPLVELTLIFERDRTPSKILVETVAKVLVPEGSAMMSEIIDISADDDIK